MAIPVRLVTRVQKENADFLDIRDRKDPQDDKDFQESLGLQENEVRN
jgi:hypothetical protein